PALQTPTEDSARPERMNDLEFVDVREVAGEEPHGQWKARLTADPPRSEAPDTRQGPSAVPVLKQCEQQQCCCDDRTYEDESRGPLTDIEHDNKREQDKEQE